MESLPISMVHPSVFCHQHGEVFYQQRNLGILWFVLQWTKHTVSANGRHCSLHVCSILSLFVLCLILVLLEMTLNVINESMCLI